MASGNASHGDDVPPSHGSALGGPVSGPVKNSCGLPLWIPVTIFTITLVPGILATVNSILGTVTQENDSGCIFWKLRCNILYMECKRGIHSLNMCNHICTHEKISTHRCKWIFFSLHIFLMAASFRSVTSWRSVTRLISCC